MNTVCEASTESEILLRDGRLTNPLSTSSDPTSREAGLV